MEYFPAAKDNAINDRINDLLKSFALSPEDLLAKWETFALSNGGDLELTPDTIENFKSHLQLSFEHPRKKLKHNHMPITLRSPPTTSRVAHPPSTGPIPQATGMLENNIILTLNRKVSLPEHTSLSTPVNFEIIHDFNYRPMFQKLSDASRTLDLEIENVISRIDIPRSEIVNPSHVNLSGSSLAVGRVVSESFEDGPLTSKGCLLETSRRIGAGARVSLDLSGVKRPVFRGEIIVARGTNPSGSEFVVTELLPLPQLPMLNEVMTSHEVDPMRILVVSAPFEQDDYEPLRKLVAHCKFEPPSAVILTGPLVHDSIGEDEQYRKNIYPLLSQLPGQLIIIPSVHELLSAQPVFPQPGIELPTSAMLPEAHCPSDPAIFKLNEISIVATSTPGIEDIRSTSTQQEQKVVTQATAFRHILRQGRIYPVHPSVNIPIDVPHLPMSYLNQKPNILVVPSPESYSAEVVDGVICVNPGKACEQFARITINPGKELLQDRTRVDFISM